MADGHGFHDLKWFVLLEVENTCRTCKHHGKLMQDKAALASSLAYSIYYYFLNKIKQFDIMNEIMNITLLDLMCKTSAVY